MLRAIFLSLCSCSLAACATAGEEPVDPVDAAPDVIIDAPPDVVDAPPGTIDAPPGQVDSAVPIDAPPPGCTDMQLLQSPGFESGGSGWTQEPGGLLPLIGPPTGGVVAYDGISVATMGFVILAHDELYQDVSIPAGTTRLELHGQRWIETSDGTGSVFDTLIVSIRNTANDNLATLRTWSNVDAGTAWAPFIEISPQPFAGQTIRLHFDAQNDFSGVTTFSLDFVELVAEVCQ